MNKATVLGILSSEKPNLEREFGVRSLALFGSAARDEIKADSDIDILVEFSESATSKQYFGTMFRLEDLIGRPIDLVSKKALRTELKPFIEREAIRV